MPYPRLWKSIILLLFALSLAVPASANHYDEDDYFDWAEEHEEPAQYYDEGHSSASFPNYRQSTGNRIFIFDPRLKMWAAYDSDGTLVNSGRASGGKAYCPDVRRPCLTPRGEFKVHRKGNAYCVSSKFPLGKGGAPMPHCMFFHRGYAIHGSPNVPNHNASHGCIRVLPSAAAWLHQRFIRIGTTIIVRPY